MLSTLDRHIARQYLFNVVALLVLLFSFVVTVDVTLNLDRFMDRAEKIESEAAVTAPVNGVVGGGGGHAVNPRPEPSALRKAALTALLVFDLWWPRLLQLFNFTIGLCLVGAMGFTFTQLVRNREMVAVLAGGISLHRLLVPVFIVAAAMMGLKVLNQELVLSNPRIAPLLARDPGDAGTREMANFKVPLTADGRGRVWFAADFEPRSGLLSGVEIWQRDSRGVVTSRISADSATWSPTGPAGAGPGWNLTHPRLTTSEMTQPGAARPARTSSSAAPDRIETDLEPSTLLFKRFASFRQCLSWRQMSGMLRSPQVKPELREDLERIRWGRVSMVLSGLLSLAITMPFFLMREPRNMVIQSLKCAPVGIISLMGGTLLAAMPIPGLPPGFAVFLPVLVLLPIAVAVLSSLRT